MSPEEIAFFEEVERLILPIPELNIEYRVYYNELGEIYRCSMQNHEDGQYITVSKDEYDNYFRYRVADGVLKKIEQDAGYRVKLTKSDKGYVVVAGHAGLLLEPGETYNNIENYEYRNN